MTGDLLNMRVKELQARAATAPMGDASAGRLAPDVLTLIRRLELNRVLLPKAHGGFEAGLATLAEVLTQVGEVCASTAWCLGIYNVHAWVAQNLYSEALCTRVFGENPEALVAGSLSPVGTLVAEADGFRLSGSWKFVSGFGGSDWVLLGAMVDGNQRRICLVPSASVVRDAAWKCNGLPYTDSGNVSVQGVFLPLDFVADSQAYFLDGRPGFREDAATYRLPWRLVFPLGLLGSALGPVAAALAGYKLAIGARKGVLGFVHSQYAPAHVRYGEAMCALDAARQLVLRDCQDADLLAANGGRTTEAEMARVTAHFGYAVLLCKRAVETLSAVAGGQSLMSGNPLHQALCDLQVVASHMAFNADTCLESLGRDAFGLSVIP